VSKEEIEIGDKREELRTTAIRLNTQQQSMEGLATQIRMYEQIMIDLGNEHIRESEKWKTLFSTKYKLEEEIRELETKGEN